MLVRRTLLRNALTISAAAAAPALLAACTPNRPVPATGAGTTGPTPPEATSNPSFAPSAHLISQELAELGYDTNESISYEQAGQALTKRAIVYLPYGYTANRQYNVFYLMHGGWGDETRTLGTPGSPSNFKNVLDNAIAAGEIAPLIVVCPTYNNTSPNDSGNFSLALQLNENYHHELLNDLVPAVESSYCSYAENVSPDGLTASRDHRGFGGFSMGAVATWRTFQNGLDYFRYFLPMSCGTSLDMDTILAAAQNRDPADYFVWIITGTDDFAHPYDQARAQLFRGSPYFTEADTEQDGNFAFRVKKGYAHDGVAAAEYTYNGLRWFWSS